MPGRQKDHRDGPCAQGDSPPVHTPDDFNEDDIR